MCNDLSCPLNKRRGSTTEVIIFFHDLFAMAYFCQRGSQFHNNYVISAVNTDNFILKVIFQFLKNCYLENSQRKFAFSFKLISVHTSAPSLLMPNKQCTAKEYFYMYSNKHPQIAVLCDYDFSIFSNSSQALNIRLYFEIASAALTATEHIHIA